MAKKRIGKTRNNYDVYMIVENNHMLAHPEVTEELITEALQKVKYMPTFWMESVDMGRIIGKDKCVEISENDDVRWICRPGRKNTLPVVFNKEPEDTTLLTIGICTDHKDGCVTVFTAFPGLKAPKEPNNPNLREFEREESERFWSTHALCYSE